MSAVYTVIRKELTFKGESCPVQWVKAGSEAEAHEAAAENAGMEGERAWLPPRAKILSINEG